MIDALVFDLQQSRTFKKSDFFETRGNLATYATFDASTSRHWPAMGNEIARKEAAIPNEMVKQARKNQKNENGGFSDLMKELWEAAVALRGTIEPADYKRYVLPIIFLRFLSLRYGKRLAELTAYVQEGRAGYDVGTENLDAILSDPDEYRSGGAFIVPENARWDSIVANAQRDDIKTYLDDVLQLLEDTYPDKLRGLLPRIYAGSNLTPDNLRGLINIFSRDVFRQGHGGEDLIGRVYEYFISEFASSEGKAGWRVLHALQHC